MLTVPQAARRVGRDPETVRRWIRAGRLPSRRVGTQHVIDEADLALFSEARESLPVPKEWATFDDETPQPDWVALVAESRAGH